MIGNIDRNGQIYWKSIQKQQTYIAGDAKTKILRSVE